MKLHIMQLYLGYSLVDASDP